MQKEKFIKFIVCSIILTIVLPQIAFAYVGPGSGLSAIGAFLALIAGVFVAILGFLWYPIKRLLSKKKSQEPDKVVNKKA